MIVNKRAAVIVWFLIYSSFLSFSISAFIIQHPSLAQTTKRTTIRKTSTCLFANNKKKNKKTKKNSSSCTRGSGTGFGSTRSNKRRQDKDTTSSPSPQDASCEELQLGPLEMAFRAEVEKRQRQRDTGASSSSPPNVDNGTELTAKASNDDDDDDEEEETQKLMALYTQEFQQEQEQHSLPSQQLVQVSSNPLIFSIDNFIDPTLCEKVQSNGAGCFDLFFPEHVADLVFKGQESEMDGLLFLEASSTDHNKKQGQYYPDGLHVDTNNQCWERHVTCILYLNDVPEHCGGATVFPLARALPNDPALQASHRLLQEQISHTRSKNAAKEDALLLESRIECTNFIERPETDTAIRIQPKAGRLLIFFSRQANGQEDPRTWHAGERLLDDNNRPTKKRIINLFKQVDYGDEPPKGGTKEMLEDYLSPQILQQRNWLQALALTKAPILYRGTIPTKEEEEEEE